VRGGGPASAPIGTPNAKDDFVAAPAYRGRAGHTRAAMQLAAGARGRCDAQPNNPI
jgi:hypothetical protein